MKVKFLSVVITSFLLIVCGAANAGLITELSERDWLSANDGLLTFDSSTRLEWLDLSVTRGNSILQTESEIFFGNFRWATSSEIEALLDKVFDGSLNRHTSNINIVMKGNEFVDLFSRDSSDYAQGLSRGAISSSGTYGLGYVHAVSNYAWVADPLHNCCFTETNSNTRIGSWLVRTAVVSEPSTIIIFTIGIIGLGSRRFKK